MEIVTDYIFGGSKISADGDCSHKIKRHLLLGRKVMTNLGSILKSRDITLLTKVHLVKAMVFPVVMYGCESWTIKKAEHQRIDAFELWYDGSDGKVSACNVGDLGSTPGSGRSPGELEKKMATHSSTLAWKIPWTEEPGRLQSMGLQRVRHD